MYGKCLYVPLHTFLANCCTVVSSQDDLRHIHGELSTVRTLLVAFHESRLSVARELTTKWEKSREQCVALEVCECELQHVQSEFIPLFYFTWHSAYVNLFSGFKHGTVSEV